MKRIITILIVATLCAGSVAAADVGGGVSLFVPMSVFSGTGSISYEASLSTTLSFGKFLGVPIGIAYDKIDGLTLSGSLNTSQPAILSDTVLGFAGLSFTLPLGPFFATVDGGGLGVWNVDPVAFDGVVASASEQAGTFRAFSDLAVKAPFGYGYFAGGSAGVKIKKISVSLSATYRWARSPAQLSGDYYTITTTGPSVGSQQSYSEAGAWAILSGFLFGVTGQFSF